MLTGRKWIISTKMPMMQSLFENLYMRVQAFHEKLKVLAENYVQKNLAVFSHGQFLQLLMMQIQQPQPISKDLM